MKFVQSFWSRPILEIRDDPKYRDKPGNIGSLDWLDRSYFFYSWALSALLLHRQGRPLLLVTDAVGKNLLVDLIGLPYGEVSLALNDLREVEPDFWCLAKLVAYGEVREPFLHVDYDVLLTPAFVDGILGKGLVALHREDDVLTAQVAEKIGSAIPIDVGREGRSMNAGVVGGTEWRLLGEFAEGSMANVLAHREPLLKLLDEVHPKYINRFFDQTQLYHFMLTRGHGWHFCLEQVNTRKDGLGAVYSFPASRGCVHLNHEYRRNSRVCRQVKSRLQSEFPLYGERIDELLRAGEL